MDNLIRYLPEEVPNYLFTRNELKQMGLVPINEEEHEAWVTYTDQKREYKLYHINKTRRPKPQKNKGISLTITNRTIDDILEKRRKRFGNK
ncbi:hypothetical protein ACNR9V_01010 [Parageobacillus thermoglucosidasius]|uniref:hypothetical protein n=1 Tax=Parageobacillus thermoglucosidasius TaxID=1426 RepID=UPI003B67CF67